MAKKIKTFTTDEEVYNRLISIFKKYKAETSISEYLNNKLKELLVYLEQIEMGIKDYNYSIPMQFVIDEEVRYCRKSSVLDEDKLLLHQVIDEIEDNYEADKKGIPREYYEWVKNEDRFELTKDKKFIIEKKTGKKYISSGENSISLVSEIDKKKLKRNKEKVDE